MVATNLRHRVFSSEFEPGSVPLLFKFGGVKEREEAVQGRDDRELFILWDLPSALPASARRRRSSVAGEPKRPATGGRRSGLVFGVAFFRKRLGLRPWAVFKSIPP